MVYFDSSTANSSNSIHPNSGWTTSTITASTNPYINALLSEYGQKWGGATGTGVTLSYSFPWSNGQSAWFTYDGDPDATVHFGFSAQQQAMTRLALQSWSNVANIKFVEVADTATSVGIFRFGFSSGAEGSWGHASYPNDYWPQGGDVWVNPTYNKQWAAVSYDMMALVHEIGHGLGLKHPFSGTSTMPKDLDFRSYTVMSYTNPATIWVLDTATNTYIFPINKPMVYDVLAIQYLYGANQSYNTGNDIYRYDGSKGFFDTIWDAGGRDLLDLSNFSGNNTIDLRAGAYSTVRTAGWEGSNNLGIAFGVTIEEASGGSGNDIITGNAIDNILRGNGGNDTLYGGTGNDILFGGTGRNTLDGGAGFDHAGYDNAGQGYSVRKSGDNYIVTARDGSSTDTLISIEKLMFSDGFVSFDTAGIAGMAYRLYQAAFARVPDKEGLGYWIDRLESGTTNLKAVADSFVHSPEFVKLYGSETSVSNSTYVGLLYTNTLGRQYDQEGFNYWVSRLDNAQTTRDDLLAFFSESDENKATVAADIADGIWYV